MNDRNRQPRGIPTGGQFSASAHAEANGVSLDTTDPFGEPVDTTTSTDDVVLTAAEFAEAVKASQALRMLDDPEAVVVLPDGSRAEIIPDQTVGDIVEEGTYFVHRPDDSTQVHGFSDLGERGKIADEIAFATTRDAVHYGTLRTAEEHTAEHTADSAFPPGTVRDGNGTALGPDGTLYKDDPGSFWHGTEIISIYTRDQAIADGVLRDHSEMAREAGIAWPVALTSAAHVDTVSWDDKNVGLQDETGRAWDVMWMASLAIKARARQSDSIQAGDRIPFEMVRVPNTPRAQQPRKVTLHAVLSPDHTGKPCWTIMGAGES